MQQIGTMNAAAGARAVVASRPRSQATRSRSLGLAARAQGNARPTAAAAARPDGSSSGSSPLAAAAASGSGAEASLLRRVLASCSPADGTALALAAVLGGCVLLGGAEPALAAALGGEPHAHAGPAQLLGDLAENEDFWSNVLRYISYFFSVLLGTVYIAVRPIIELLKRPGTAVLVVAGLGGLFYFVSFTVQAMLGINDSIDPYTASSIVTPQL